MRVPAVFAFLALVVTSSLSLAQSVTFDEATTVQLHPKKVGINLQAPAYYGANELYKNLLWKNPGFEPSLVRQKLVASIANGGGSTTVFVPELFSSSGTYPYGAYNASDLVTANFWSGATFWLGRSGSSAMQAKVNVCSGTIASNTAGTATSAPQYTFASPCSTPVLPGDVIVLRRLAPCAADDITLGNAGWWLPVTTDTNILRTDCTTPYEGAQSLVLDASVAGSKSEIDAYIDDSSSASNGILFNGQYTISGYFKTYSGATPTLSVAVNRQLAAGSAGNPIQWPGSQCTNNGTFAASAAWTAFSMTCTGSETSDLVPSRLKIAFIASGGAVDIDSVSLSKSAGTDPTNTTVFRDEVVATLKAHCAGASLVSSGVPCEIRSYALGDGDDISNTIKPLRLRSPAVYAFEYAQDSNRIGLEEFLELCSFVGAEPYFTLPETMAIPEAANWIEYLYGASTTPYGALRLANGQSNPWGNTFSTIHLEMGNENWNPSAAAGVNMLPDLINSPITPWAGGDPTFDYTTDTAGLWNAMRSSASWPTSKKAVDLVLNLQEHGWPGWIHPAMSRTGATSGELGAYTQGGVNSVDSLTALWQPLMYEVVAKTTNPNVQFYQSMYGLSYSGSYLWPGILASGGNVNIYEFDNDTITPSSNLTQNVLDSFTVSAGYGTATALQALSNLSAGIVDQNFMGLSTYIGIPPIYKGSSTITGSSATANVITLVANQSFAAGDYACFSGLVNANVLNGLCLKVLATGLTSASFQISLVLPNLAYAAESGATAIDSLSAHHWGAAVDMGGSTTTPGSTTGATLLRPQELGLRMANAAIIGPMYACSVANPTTAVIDPNNQNGSEWNGTGYWTPPPVNSTAIPQQYAFCFMQGPQRSMILINTDVANAHPITFAANGAPLGQVTATRYAPASISQSNDAPGSDLVTGYQPSVVIQAPTTLSAPTSDMLPPFSVTRYDWSTDSTPTTVTLSVGSGSSVYVGSAITINAAVSANLSFGTVTFLDNGVAISSALPVAQGGATFSYTGAATGSHVLTAAYTGASGYASSISSAVSVTVSLMPTMAVLSASASTIPVGQSVTVSATVTATTGGATNTPTGNVTFAIDGAAAGTVTLNNSGVAAYAATLSTSGSHTITATYAGDSTHSSTNGSLNVVATGPAATTTTASITSTLFAVSQPAVVNVHVSCNSACGNVDFKEDGVEWGVLSVDSNGNASAATNGMHNQAIGQHTLVLTYLGSSQYAASTSNTLTFNIVAMGSTATTTTASITSTLFAVSQPAVVNVHVSCNSACGNVDFKEDGVEWGVLSVDSNGNASAATNGMHNQAIGQHTLVLTYLGSSQYAASTSNTLTFNIVAMGSTVTTTTASITSTLFAVSQPAVVNVHVSCNSACGNVDFKEDGVEWGVLSVDSNGNASAATNGMHNQAIGQHTLVLTYLGNSQYAASTSNTLTFNIVAMGSTAATTTASITSTLFAVSQPAVVNVHVSCNSACGNVDFKEDGIEWGVLSVDSNGNASAATNGMPNQAIGQHTLVLTYLGNSQYAASTSNTLTFNIVAMGSTAATTTASITSTLFAASQPAVVNVHVSCNSACGNVDFKEDGVEWGVLSVDSNGNASAATNGMHNQAIGQHTLVLTYLGNSQYAASTSNTLTFNITN